MIGRQNDNNEKDLLFILENITEECIMFHKAT